MKALKYIFLLLLIVVIGLAIYVAVQPNSYDVSRTRTIKAPASVVYNEVIDYKSWPKWMAWIEKNPDMKLNWAEQTEGVGGSYSWEDKEGNGNMKTLAANPYSTIDQQMQWEDYDPSDVYWKFEPAEDGTKVTWGMKSDKIPFFLKGFAAFSGGMDAMMGPDFERGLERLDSVAISSMKAYNIKVNGVVEHGGGYYLYNTVSCRIDEVASKIQQMMPKVGSYAMSNNIQMAGAPFTYYHSWDEKNGTTMFSCAVPTTERVITTEGDILTGQMEPFKALKVTLKGNYDNLKEAWDVAMKEMEKQGLEFTEDGPMLEVYANDPGEHPNPAEWLTEIYIAVK